MNLTQQQVWEDSQVLNMKVVTGAKQAAVVAFETPLTMEIAKTLGCEAVYCPNGTSRGFFKRILLDVGKLKDARLKADGCDLSAKLISGFSLAHTDDGLMLRFTAKFVEGFFEIVAGFVQDRKDDPFALTVIPTAADARATSEDHAVAPAPDSPRVQ